MTAASWVSACILSTPLHSPLLLSCTCVSIHSLPPSTPRPAPRFSAHRFYDDNWETVLLYQTVPVLPDGLSHLPGCKKGGEQRLFYMKVVCGEQRGASLSGGEQRGASLSGGELDRSNNKRRERGRKGGWFTRPASGAVCACVGSHTFTLSLWPSVAPSPQRESPAMCLSACSHRTSCMSHLPTNLSRHQDISKGLLCISCCDRAFLDIVKSKWWGDEQSYDEDTDIRGAVAKAYQTCHYPCDSYAVIFTPVVVLTS